MNSDNKNILSSEKEEEENILSSSSEEEIAQEEQQEEEELEELLEEIRETYGMLQYLMMSLPPNEGRNIMWDVVQSAILTVFGEEAPTEEAPTEEAHTEDIWLQEQDYVPPEAPTEAPPEDIFFPSSSSQIRSSRGRAWRIEGDARRFLGGGARGRRGGGRGAGEY
jgi:hypothetical protein